MNNLSRRMLFQSKKDYHVYVGDAFAGPIKSHYHEFYQCMYVFNGKLLQKQNGQSVLQSAGDAFFTPPRCNHSLYVFDEDTRYYCLSFSRSMADALFAYFPRLDRNFCNLRPVITVPAEVRARLAHCLSSLIDEQNHDSSSLFRTGQFLTLSALLMILRREYTVALLSGVPTSPEALSDVFRCIEYIDGNYSKPLSVDELTHISKLSKSSLYRAFQQYTGKAIMQYITEKRINAATILISEDNSTSIGSIAKAVGFDEFSTFYRNFVKIVGLPPSQYRSIVQGRTDDPKGADYSANSKACIGCMRCEKACDNGAVTVEYGYVRIDKNACVNCGECLTVCPSGCITETYHAMVE